jgi:myo-inositol-1(or 4)-monophosphatase
MIIKQVRDPSFNVLRDVAVEASQAAGKALLKRFRTKLKISEKSDAGLVTNADIEAELAAIRVLKRKFPHFGILAEESAEQMGESAGRWILDPLDGTTNFAHGHSVFCVSVAAEWKGEVVAGAIFHPVSGDLYTAVRGKGAFVNGKRMKVSSVGQISAALLSTGFNSRKDLHLANELQTFERMSRMASGVRRPGSAALDLAHVARGIFDGFWETGLAPWDIAAGMLMIEEAGGKVTDFSGRTLRLNGGEIVASNGTLHRAIFRGLTKRSSDASMAEAHASSH